MSFLSKKKNVMFFLFLYITSSQSIFSSEQNAMLEKNLPDSESNLSDDDELEYWPKYMDDLPYNFLYFDLNDPHHLDHCFYDDEDEHNKDLAMIYATISKNIASKQSTSDTTVRGSFSTTVSTITQNIDSETCSDKQVKAAKNVQFAPIDQVAASIKAVEPKRPDAANNPFIVRSHSPVNYNEMNPKTRTKILSIFSLAQLHKMTENDFALEPCKKK